MTEKDGGACIRNLCTGFGVFAYVRIRNGRRNGLLLILLALMIYAGWLRWAVHLQHLLAFDLSTVVITVCELTGIVGALLVIVAFLPPTRPQFPPTGAIPIMGVRRRRRTARQRKRDSKFVTLPHFGLFCSLLLPMFMFLFPLTGVNTTSIGLRVRLFKDISETHSSKGAPLFVTVHGSQAIAPNSPGSEEIPKADLRHALEVMLRNRPDKIVFIQPEDDVEYRSVVAAVDAAKSTGARVVLVTSPQKGNSVVISSGGEKP